MCLIFLTRDKSKKDFQYVEGPDTVFETESNTGTNSS